MKNLIVGAILLSSSSVFANWFCDSLDFSSRPFAFNHEKADYLKVFCEYQMIEPFHCKVLNFEGEKIFVKQDHEESVLDYCIGKTFNRNTTQNINEENKTSDPLNKFIEVMAFLSCNRR
jgi:hypothetical protein